MYFLCQRFGGKTNAYVAMLMFMLLEQRRPLGLTGLFTKC